jgi:predicted nuclease of predicted toxin-antitoxin system
LRGFLRSGYDAVTVLDQNLGGHPDTEVALYCQREARAIVTLDMGFADIRAYPPADYCGIIVLRPARQDKAHLLTVIRSVIPVLQREPLDARLWIVDEVSVRIHA